MFPNSLPSYSGLKEALLKYSSLLKASKLTNEVLSSLPLPRTLDPSRPTPIPSRLSTLANLVGSSIACAIPLTFLTLPLAINAPAYVMSRYGANLAVDEEETQAQNKIAFGLLLTAGSYGFIFWAIWAFFWLTPIGAVLAASIVWLLYTFYLRTIDDFYARQVHFLSPISFPGIKSLFRAKKLIAAWRVLIGVWGPRAWDMDPKALAPFTVPEIPPPNIWIDRPLTPTPAATPVPVTPAPQASGSSPQRKKKPASRSLIRHVLRARIEASRALGVFLAELETHSPRVRVSSHLGHPDGSIEEGYVSGLSSSNTSDYLDVGKASTSGSRPNTPGAVEEKAFLEGREIIHFLRSRGANIEHRSNEGDWAALSSDEDSPRGTVSPGADEVDEVQWVPSGKAAS